MPLVNWLAPSHKCCKALTWAAFALLSFLTLTTASFAADKEYIVKRGDTLYDIAREQKIGVADLAKRNDLEKNAHIYAGQRLRIPSPKGSTTASKSSSPATSYKIPSHVQQAIDKAPVRTGRWKYIVLHHSGMPIGSPKSMDRYHREVRHMENGLAYHFVIGNGSGMADGEISVGRRWTRQLDGGHLASETQNSYCLGICLVGNFDRQNPTPKQMQSLRALVKALMTRCKLPPAFVKTHQEINVVSTRCPGKKFSGKAFRASL